MYQFAFPTSVKANNIFFVFISCYVPLRPAYISLCSDSLRSIKVLLWLIPILKSFWKASVESVSTGTNLFVTKLKNPGPFITISAFLLIFSRECKTIAYKFLLNLNSLIFLFHTSLITWYCTYFRYFGLRTYFCSQAWHWWSFPFL